MSKKSRRRNKRLLGLLGVLGAGLAMSKKGTAAADVDSGRGGDSSSAVARTIANAPSKSDVAIVPPVKPKKVSVPVGKMKGAGNTDAEAIAAQKTRADYARNARINALNTSEGSPMIDNPYVEPSNRVIKGRLGMRTFKSGGRAKLKSGGKVKGCGKALRGFGRAMKGRK